MAEYIMLMHDDLPADADASSWAPYLQRLRDSGALEGGSEIGGGICLRKSGVPPPITAHLVGYIRVAADRIDDAIALVAGNPHFEAGGTVEVRELPRTG